MRKFAYIVLFIIIMFALPACSMKKAVSGMSLKLQKVHVTHIDRFGFDAMLYMEVNNPNWFGMTVSDVRYQAFVDGQELAKGYSDKELVIPANGSAVAELPLEVSYNGVKDKMYDILKGRLGYRVTGEVGFKTWLGRYAVKFDTEKKPTNGKEDEPSREGGGEAM
jgi:LEA14-like dessication related protein